MAEFILYLDGELIGIFYDRYSLVLNLKKYSAEYEASRIQVVEFAEIINDA